MNVGVSHPGVSTIYRELGLGRHPEVLEGREGDVGYLPRINLPPEVMKLLLHTCPFRQEIGRRLDLMRRDKGAWLLEGVRPLARKRSWFGCIICSGRRPRPNISWGKVAGRRRRTGSDPSDGGRLDMPRESDHGRLGHLLEQPKGKGIIGEDPELVHVEEGIMI
ncbi:hypothetical protein Taro_025000 [Colocasia esculenta]|uniref:Uncharacterized protein n=1 Tax=Colocasia esculenta TaxID=4460 RepID=A0A843V913_COLES|nr:hypothetical protein [Colocasia esculenta]